MVPSERQGTSRWLRAGGDGCGGVREEGGELVLICSPIQPVKPRAAQV